MGYCYTGASGANSLEGGVHQNLIAKFSHFNASTRFSYNLLHDYVHMHNTTVGHFNRTGTRYDNHVNTKLRNELQAEHKAQSEFFDMPQDFKGYLNTSYYKKTDEQFLISPIPHNKKQTFAIDDLASDNIIGSPADRFLANLLCNGDTIFYRLPEQLLAYKKVLETKQDQILTAAEPKTMRKTASDFIHKLICDNPLPAAKSGLLVIPAEALLLPFECNTISENVPPLSRASLIRRQHRARRSVRCGETDCAGRFNSNPCENRPDHPPIPADACYSAPLSAYPVFVRVPTAQVVLAPPFVPQQFIMPQHYGTAYYQAELEKRRRIE
ncbi:hypothetical protein V1520DRAFT_329918 [Lipomyces starkeyi]